MRMLTKIFLVFNILGGAVAQVALPDGKICTILAKISENNSILEIMCGCSVQNFHTFDQISIFSPSLRFASPYYPHIAAAAHAAASRNMEILA